MACKDKLQFPTYIDANRYMLELKSRYGGTITSKRVYQCDVCKNYHLTRQNKKQLIKHNENRKIINLNHMKRINYFDLFRYGK